MSSWSRAATVRGRTLLLSWATGRGSATAARPSWGSATIAADSPVTAPSGGGGVAGAGAEAAAAVTVASAIAAPVARRTGRVEYMCRGSSRRGGSVSVGRGAQSARKYAGRHPLVHGIVDIG